MIPQEVKDELARLKQLRKEQTAQLPSGSQKAFFARVWERLHAEDQGDEGDKESDSHSSIGNGKPYEHHALKKETSNLSTVVEPVNAVEAMVKDSSDTDEDDVTMANATAAV